MANKINAVTVLRSDARVRPSEAGADFAKYLHKNNLLASSLEVDVRDVHASVLISAFFVNFMESLHKEGGIEAVTAALNNIRWVARYDFQSSNINRWMAPYREKLNTTGEPEFTGALSLVDRLDACQREKDEIMRQFRMCPVWKAIQKYIEKSNADECGIVDKRDGLVHHRGTGAFSLKKVYAYPAGADDPRNAVRFCFDVSCWDEESEREVDADVMLDIPLQLVIDFDQELFDEWVAERGKERRERDLKRAEVELEKFFNRYPELRAKHESQ